MLHEVARLQARLADLPAGRARPQRLQAVGEFRRSVSRIRGVLGRRAYQREAVDDPAQLIRQPPGFGQRQRWIRGFLDANHAKDVIGAARVSDSGQLPGRSTAPW